MSTLPQGAWRMNVAAIILDDAGHILLGKPARGTHYHLPQGGVKSHESQAEALERELREEVGLTGCRVLAEYAGLRYDYRRKNEKSKRWLGQQQTYYLLHCPGNKPAVDCSGSAEFASATWLPLAELRPELFVSFKRQAIARALEHYFPGGVPCPPAELCTRCTPLLYRHTPGQAPPATAGSPLFAGKREEALYHMAHTAPLRLRKKQRLLVVITGMEGCGIKKCLRHISHSLDPLATRYHLYPKRLDQPPHTELPQAGEICFLTLHPEHETAAAYHAWEAMVHREGIPLLKIGLHLSRAKQLRRLSRKDATPKLPWSIALREFISFVDTTSTTQPWTLLPAEYGWYRDVMMLTMLSGALAR